jgi:hypothetical protein
MARTNVKLIVRQPGVDGLSALLVWTDGTADGLRIPRRYPFADIANYAALKTSGFFRHATADVSSEMGGSSVAGSEGGLGYQLPPTEKLILLVRKGATTEELFTIKGSPEYSIDDEVISVPVGAIGDIYECDLFNMGLFLAATDSEPGLSLDTITTTLDFCLIVRSMG